LDLNQDGIVESVDEQKQAWFDGMNTLLSNTRNVLGPDTIIMTNSGDEFHKYINGVLYEDFPIHGWSQTLDRYEFILDRGQDPAIAILNTNVKNTGRYYDYRRMRFGLTSALMGDGFYSFDNGDLSHHEIWWYDEFQANLGQPISQAVRVDQGATNDLNQGIWRRDFEKGIAIVNATPKLQVVDLKQEFEKLHGQQDAFTNDGAIVSQVTLRPYDGIILLKSLEHLEQISFVNGSYARFFDQWGQLARTGFLTYDSRFAAGAQIIKNDLNQDGLVETLVATKSRIEVFNSKNEKLSEFYPYNENYNKGINIALGDINNDGTIEIVTGTQNGAGPQIRIFNYQGELINPGFFAFDPESRGGVNVAIGDLDSDGTMEIIAGAGQGSGSHVKVFNYQGELINPGFFAYDAEFRGGVNVAVGDVSGDGQNEIITAPGPGGGPHIKVFDLNGTRLFAQFYAFDQDNDSGIQVFAVDVDGDGVDEIMAASREVF
jgi:hypothetical protein